MTLPSTLTLGAEALRTLREHAASAYPHECCGALIGDAGRGEVEESLPLPNTAAEGPRRRFLVSPQDYLVAERHAAGTGRTLLGFYHSHPDHPARPSSHDLSQAWPTLHYVIVSVQEGRPADVTCWSLSADRSTFVEVGVRS